MNNTALAVRTDTMDDWQVMRDQATILVKTGFLPQAIKTAEQALAIILTGRELGIGTMQALNTINVIAGKPTISPQLMLALINRTGQLEDMSITDDGQACTVRMKRRGRTEHAETFSMKDAALMKTTDGYGENKKTISLSEKYNWRQMPGVMRKWRAVAACARVVFPDVILGLYTHEEMGAAVEPESGEIDLTPRDGLESGPYHGPHAELLGEVDAIVVNNEPQLVEIQPEPEPVRDARLECAQNGGRQASKPQPRGTAGQILALTKALGWDDKTLAGEIHDRFEIALSPENFTEALAALPHAESRELIQALKAELENRNRTR